MTDYVQSILDFERNVQDGLLTNCAVLELRVRLPVVPELVDRARGALEILRQGQPLDDAHGAKTLRDCVETCVDQYDQELQKYHKKRLEAQGVNIGAGGLTRIERDALKSYLLWLIMTDTWMTRSGERGTMLARALEHDEAH